MTRIGTWMYAFLVIAGSATAQPAQTPNDQAAQALVSRLQPGATLNRFLEALRQEFRELDADLDGELTAADADLLDNIARAQFRASQAMNILRADLDGDGFVTADELRRFLRHERRANLGQAGSSDAIEAEVRRLLAADADGDGKISLAEAFAFNDTRPETRNFVNQTAVQLRRLLTLAPAGDNKLTLAEFEAAGAAVFRRLDTDGNGTISQDEFNDFRRREADAARDRSQAASRTGCTMPRASSAATVVVLSAYKSEAISSVGLGSQDMSTGTGEIRIEAGDGPLYVVVIAHDPTIWRVIGATDRVERLVAFGATANPTTVVLGATPGAATTPRGPGAPLSMAQEQPVPATLAGIIGLPADRVSFLARSDCLRYFAEAKSSDGAIVVAAVRRDSGKEPSVIAARHNVAAFLVPSGEIRSAYDDKKQPRLTIQKSLGTLTLKGDTTGVIVQTGPTDLEADLEQFSPGGAIELDLAAVVGSAPAVRYEILPGAAGMLALQNAGAITRNQRGEFLIHRKIRFPAGLSGLSVSFLLLRGVPLPDGRPDGATVISEETGEPIRFPQR